MKEQKRKLKRKSDMKKVLLGLLIGLLIGIGTVLNLDSQNTIIVYMYAVPAYFLGEVINPESCVGEIVFYYSLLGLIFGYMSAYISSKRIKFFILFFVIFSHIFLTIIGARGIYKEIQQLFKISRLNIWCQTSVN